MKQPVNPGDKFSFRNAEYKVKSVKWMDYDGEGKFEWRVLAWRFVKTTQKYSGNAYGYRWDNEEMKII